MSKKILLVDDEPDILEFLGYNLQKEGFIVFKANNGAEGLKIAEVEKPDLILIDIMMPEMDGIEACEILRKKKVLKNTIIVFLTARSEEYTQLASYNAGGDDYVTKPIKPKILISKIKAIFRRINQDDDTDKVIKIENISIDREQYKILIDKKEINLPRKEFELIALLASKPEKVFKREEILEKVWGSEVVVGGRTIDVHIRKLREKIGSKRFSTVKGIGYKFNLLEK